MNERGDNKAAMTAFLTKEVREREEGERGALDSLLGRERGRAVNERGDKAVMTTFLTKEVESGET